MADLTKAGVIFQIGVEPVRIDILTDLDGLDFESAHRRSVRQNFGTVEVKILSIADLIKNKSSVGRPQDLLDVAKLKAIGARPAPSQSTPRSPKRRRRT